MDSPPARNIAANILPALAAVAIVWSGWPVWISLRAYQWRDPTEANARAVLEAAPPDAVILANWHHVTPLWTLQAAGLRPDVEARYVYPLGAEPILDTWARLITEEAQEGRPLITCSYYPELFRHTGRTFSALESCWQVGELEVPLPDEPPLARFDGFAVRRHADDAPAEFRAGETTALSLAWDWPEALPISEYVTFVHLVDGVGAVLAQDDQPFATSEIAGPGRIVQRYSLSLPRTVLPGTYRLLTGVYRRTPDGLESLRAENGQERVLLAQVDVRPARLPPITGHEWHIPLGRDLILIGYDYDLSLPGRARLYLHWWLGAPTPDEGLSLTLQNETDALAQAALHAAEAGFLTTAHDLPDVATVDGLWLQVQGQDGPLWVRGAWGLPLAPGVWLPGLQPGERYIPVGDVIVTGYAVKGEVEPGSTISATVTLRSATAITQDVSVRLALGAAARTDGTPVGGAIPTLKWGWGAAITDTLRLTLPEDLPPDPGPLTLTFYDAFTGRVWPVSDPALGADGPGLPLTP